MEKEFRERILVKMSGEAPLELFGSKEALERYESDPNVVPIANGAIFLYYGGDPVPEGMKRYGEHFKALLPPAVEEERKKGEKARSMYEGTFKHDRDFHK
jgi:hypothetical protein